MHAEKRMTQPACFTKAALAAFMLLGTYYVRADLAGHWRFDETSGVTAADSTTNGLNGALINLSGNEWVAGKKLNALNLDGTNNYVQVANNSKLQITGDLTIALWIKPTRLPDGSGSFYWVSKRNYAGEFGLCHYRDSSVVLFQGRGTASGSYYGPRVIPVNKIITNEWQHIVVTRDMATRELKGYLNGVLQNTCIYADNTNYSPPLATTYPVLIGGISGSAGLDGLIDDVIVADYAFTPDEVASLYDTAFLRGWWDMDEGAGTTAEDLSDYYNTGVLQDLDESAWVDGHPDEQGCFNSAVAITQRYDQIYVSNAASLQLTNDLSLALWVRPFNLPLETGSRRSWIHKHYGGEFSLVHYDGNKVYLIQGRSSSVYFSALVIPSNIIVSNDWQHVVVTRNMATREIKGYLDGVLQNTVTYPDNPSYSPPVETTYPIKIGSGYAPIFTGAVDKVRIYARVLTPDEILAMQPLSAYADRSYYTGEDGHAVTRLNFSALGEIASNCYLVAKNGAGAEIGARIAPELQTDVPFSTAAMPTGENAVTIELHNNYGTQERFGRTIINVVKRAPKPGCEVKVDRKNGIILRNGLPFFPMGFYMMGLSAAATSDFDAVSQAGFNTVVHWKFKEGDPAVAADYLQAAANAVSSGNPNGLAVIDAQQAYDPLNFSSTFKGDSYPYSNFWDAYNYTIQGYLELMGTPYNASPYTDNNKSIITQAVEYAKNASNLLAYYTFDEPSTNQAAAGRDLYQATNARDGYHPTFCLYSSIIPDGEQYTDWCDVLGVDPYWIPPRMTSMRTSVDWVTKYVWLTRERCRQENKAMWIAPMSEWWSASRKRAILPAEQYCQTYLALIHGAKGIFYWRYPVYHADSWTALTNLCGELTALAPAVLAPDVPQTVAYATWSASAQAYLPVSLYPPANLFTDIQVCLRQATNGNYVLLAANTKRYAVDVTFSIENLGNAMVSCPFSQFSATAVNGEFSDQLDGFGTRAYTFTGALNKPVNIGVNMTPLADNDPEPPLDATGASIPPHPDSGRVGKVNLMQNPTLDESVFTNWPDYCWPSYANPRIHDAEQTWGLVTTADIPGGGDGLPAGCGERSLQIVNPLNANRFSFYFIPEADAAVTNSYTFSAYLKSDSTNTIWVTLGGLYLNNLDNTDTCPTNAYVTDTWQRYQCTIKVPEQAKLDQIYPPDIFENNYFYILVREPGTVWVDAVQIEKAASASAFTTD